MGGENLTGATWLATADGQQALREAWHVRRHHQGDPAAAATAMRRARADLLPSQCTSALLQAELQELAAHRYGIDEGSLLLTRAGLEQGTRPEVSRARIGMLNLVAGSQVVDATAGIGLDSLSFVSAGMRVTAVEQDPITATFLRANLRGGSVLEGDITDPAVLAQATRGLTPQDLVFVDPSRRSGTRSRDGSRAHPERDPQRWSPPWSFVEGLAARFRVCAKVAPGLPSARVPVGWQAAWIATRQGPVETCLISWPALPAPRRACLVRPNSAHGDTSAHGDLVEVLDDDLAGVTAPDQPASSRCMDYLHEPSRVVVQAELVDCLARRTGLNRVAADTHWLTSSSPLDPARATGMLASYRVLDELPSGPKALRAALRSRGIVDVTIKSRGSRLDAPGWRDRLRLPEGPSAILVFLTCAGTARAFLVEHQA